MPEDTRNAEEKAPQSVEDLLKAMDQRVVAMVDAMEQHARALEAHTPRDPEKQWKDAYAKRDQYKRERDEMEQRLAVMAARVDELTARDDQARRRATVREGIRDRLAEKGVRRVAAVVKLLDLDDAGLDGLVDESGTVDEGKIEAVVAGALKTWPEFLTPAQGNGQAARRTATPPLASPPAQKGDAPRGAQSRDDFVRGAREDLKRWKHS